MIQLSVSKQMFEFLMKQLTTDLREKDFPEFTEYLAENYIRRHPNWYEGSCIREPATNNAIESFNAIIKKQYTMRERLELGKFLKTMRDLLHEQSCMRNPLSVNCKPFLEKRNISLKCWTDGFNFARDPSVAIITRVIL